MTERKLVEDLIGAFDAMAIVREALGDPAARGVRECIKHLADYLDYLDHPEGDAR